MNTAPRIPAYLPASLGLLWLWSGLQPVLTAPQQSLELLAAVGFQTAYSSFGFGSTSRASVAALRPPARAKV